MAKVVSINISLRTLCNFYHEKWDNIITTFLSALSLFYSLDVKYPEQVEPRIKRVIVLHLKKLKEYGEVSLEPHSDDNQNKFLMISAKPPNRSAADIDLRRIEHLVEGFQLTIAVNPLRLLDKE